MKKRRNRGQYSLSLLITALFLLSTGCGFMEPIQTEKPADKLNQEMDGAESDTVNPDGVAPQNAETAPLLKWEDPETENLAGMLQDTCGGMMVQLTAGRYTGSGVICGTEEDCLVIVTAGHVLADTADGVQVVFADGWEIKTVDFSLSELADMAFLKVPLREIPAQRLEKYMTANVDKSSYDSLQAGDGCIVMGCKSGVAEDAYEGIVLEPWIYMEDYGQYMIWVKAAGKPGMSGGGLFDRRGHFLGILSGVSEDGEWAVVPLALVMAEL